MLMRFIVRLIHRGTKLKRAFWHRVYETMASRLTTNELVFMNYGWAPPEGDDSTLKLSETDEPRRRWAQLYHHITRDVDLEGQGVIEVGSGRGGGASFLARTRKPATYMGIDYSDHAVRLCQSIHEVANLDFQQGDAENLPIEDGGVDVVVNVESSHCYGDLDKFVSEVARVLKPGGVFCWGDLCAADQISEVTKSLDSAGLVLERDEDITQGVVRALSMEGQARSALIARLSPWFLRPTARAFGGVPGTVVYKSLVDRRVVYLCRRYRKPSDSS